MKKVCIALDYNLSSEKIAETGYAYAKAFSAEVAIVHVFNDMMMYGMEDGSAFGFSSLSYEDEVNFENLQKVDLEKYLQASKKHLNDDTIQTQILEGITEDEILDFAKKWGADLLVIGKHKHNAIESVLLGNTAMKIVRHAKIPLLLVPVKI